MVLFPGYRGIIRLHEEDGNIRFERRGNFLVRSRRHWLDDETVTLVADAPTDQWIAFGQRFRETPRYGSDIAALDNEASREFAAKSASPLVTMHGGGPGSGDACEARTAHGFAGVEIEAIDAMRTWIRTGAVTQDAGK